MLFATTFFVGVSIGAPKPTVSFGTDKLAGAFVAGSNKIPTADASKSGLAIVRSEKAQSSVIAPVVSIATNDVGGYSIGPATLTPDGVAPATLTPDSVGPATLTPDSISPATLATDSITSATLTTDSVSSATLTADANHFSARPQSIQAATMTEGFRFSSKPQSIQASTLTEAVHVNRTRGVR